MDKFSQIEITSVLVSSKPGASLGEAQREALIVCATEWRNVILSHNGKRYRIKCNDLIATISETMPSTAGE